MNMLDDIEKDVSKNWLEIEKNKTELKTRKLKARWTVEKYISFFNLMNKLIQFNKINRKNITKQYINSVGMVNYLKEYCTVKVDIGRQIGKSTYISNNFKDNDLIITINMSMSKDFVRNFYTFYKYERNIVSYRTLLNKKDLYKLKTYDTIWVDEYSIINRQTDMSFIYDYLGKNENQTFIFLG